MNQTFLEKNILKLENELFVQPTKEISEQLEQKSIVYTKVNEPILQLDYPYELYFQKFKEMISQFEIIKFSLTISSISIPNEVFITFSNWANSIFVASLPNSSVSNLHSLIVQGNTIHIHNRADQNKLQQCFHLFKQCSDQFNDHEVHAKLSPCYYRGFGIEQDKNKSFEYLLKIERTRINRRNISYRINIYHLKSFNKFALLNAVEFNSQYFSKSLKIS
jgi:hypothetical protein